MTAEPFSTRPGIPASQITDVPLGLAELQDRPQMSRLLRQRGMRAVVADAKAELFFQCADAMAAKGISAAQPFFVPGRIELLGKHTDYCGGRSLLCAVERGFCLLVSRREDRQVHLHGVATGQTASFRLAADLQPTAGHWTNYAMTVARRVAANFGPALIGCDITFISDLPQAAGLSSSSAFIIGVFLALAAVNRLDQTPAYRDNIHTVEDLANYLGCCENGSTFGTLAGIAGVGTFGGSQDHTAILCCRPDQLSVFSFCPVRREADIPLPADVVLKVFPSGVIAEKTGSAMAKYNAVSLRARKLVELWNDASGQDQTCLNGVVTSSPDAVQRLRQLLHAQPAVSDELALEARLDQFIAESNRLIPKIVESIEARRWNEIGPLVDESQRLAETHLLNQVPQTIELQRSARHDGAIAASAFGAGFGGSVWTMYAAEPLSRPPN